MRNLHILQYATKKINGNAPMEEPDASLFIWLEQFISTARVAANQICRDQIGLALDATRLLRIIAENPDRPVSWVVRKSYFDRTFVSRTLSMFVKKKLIERMISPHDARQFLLRATPRGQKLVQKANALQEQTELRAISVLNQEERRNFGQCLAKLCTLQPEDYELIKKTGLNSGNGR